MISNLGWALWRPPDSQKPCFLQGEVQTVTDIESAAGGYYVHPFLGTTGYFISGISKNAVPQASAIYVHPGPVFQSDSRQSYLQKVQALLLEMQAGSLAKVVFSRRLVLDVPTLDAAQALALFARVAAAYPASMVSMVSLPGFGTWLSASPEVLCAYQDGAYTTMALAGTRNQENPATWTSKEYAEQRLVADYIRTTLKEQPVQIVNEHGPYNSSAGKLWHLRTDFKAEGKTNLLQIARTLHPTPAVCGLPKPQALALINKYESAPRSLYAGYLGYLPGDETEPATLYVHLRCACISSANPVLFAGGGIMPDSNPEDEWAETEDKLRVLLPFFTP